MLAALVSLVLVAVGLAEAVIAHGGVQRAADQAAIAAADTRLGLHPGAFCERADEIVRRAGATMSSCEPRPDGSVRVEASARAGAFTVTGRARAGVGPPSAR